MRSWLSRTFIVCGVFIFVWILVTISWRNSNRMPNTADAIIYLVAMPVALILILWFIGKIKAISTQTLQSTAASTSIAPPQINTAAELERTLKTHVLACAVKNLHGNSVDEMAAKFSANDIALELDSDLTDINGLPVLSGRVKDLHTEEQINDILVRLKNIPSDDIHWEPEDLRALILASDVLTELMQTVINHPLLAIYHNTKEHQRSAVQLPILRVQFLLPPRWSSTQQKIAENDLQNIITEHAWPIEKIRLQLSSSATHNQPMTVIDNLAIEAHRQSLPCFAIVIACESFIGESIVELWESQGLLFTGQGNLANIPSEGAAGVFIADQTQAQLMEVDEFALMHRVARKSREKSADESGRITADDLEQLCEATLDNAKVSGDDIELIIADTDHKVSRIGELMAVGHRFCPDLDLSTQCLKIGAACGHMGAVASLTAMTLAWFETLAKKKPILCISNQDSHLRLLTLLSPPEESSTT